MTCSFSPSRARKLHLRMLHFAVPLTPREKRGWLPEKSAVGFKTPHYNTLLFFSVIYLPKISLNNEGYG